MAEFVWPENSEAGSPPTSFHGKHPTEVLEPGAGPALSITRYHPERVVSLQGHCVCSRSSCGG